MVEVFAVQTLNEDAYQQVKPVFMRLLPLNSQERTESYTHPASQQRTLLGEVLTRKIISQKTGIAPDKFLFSLSKHGKPYLNDFPQLHFNISHSHEWVVVAVASAPVGIDVERIRKPRLDVALRFFSEEEKNVLLKLPDEEQTQYFYRLWTIKESYLKLTGEGLTASLNTFTVKQQNENFAIFKEEVKQNIHVKIYPGIPGFCLAVSSEENSFAELVNTDISFLAG